MRNSSVVNVLRTLVKQTVDANNPADLLFGVVESENPLAIKLEDKRILDEDFLLLSDMVRDYEVDIEVSHVTENTGGGSGEAAFSSHCHKYKGRKKIKVYNGLKKGEKVVILKRSGGQLFYVLCRYDKHSSLKGQWN